MKILIIAATLCLTANAATLNVCAAGCAYSTLQSAANTSLPGDTIILQAGQNLGALTMPGGWHNVTIKSSAIDAYPRNQRITRSNPALARITQVTLGDSQLWLNATVGTTTLTNQPGAQPLPHFLTVGQPVVVAGTHYSAYVCSSLNQPPYTTGACSAGRVGFINVRQNTNFRNGSIVYLIGRSAPSPLALNTPYYVVNFTAGSSWPANADQFQLSASPGGPPITIPFFDPTGQDFIITVHPLPVMIGTTLYVASTPTSTTLTLSLTPGGAPITWTQMPFNYNGAFLSSGFGAFTVNPVHDISFDGVEILPASDAGVYYPFLINSAIGNLAGEHYNITLLRSWVHGAPDQLDFPYATINIAAKNIEIGWCVIEDAYSTGNDTQGIGFQSTANVYIHDNEIKGAAEGILSGGNTPWFLFQTNTTGVQVVRNYIWKPMSYFNGIAPTYVSPTQFTLLSRFGGGDCSTVATAALQPQLAQQCFGYESQETPGTSTPPAAAVVSRDLWTATSANSTFTVTGSSSGQAGLLYWLGGVIHMDYSFGGSVTCPSGVICTHVAAPSFPVASSRIGIACVDYNATYDCPATGSTQFSSGNFYQQMRNVWSKNLIESKYGDNWLIEGNVLHRVVNIDNGSTTQYMGINLTIGVTGSGNGDPVNYLATTNNSTVRHNLFRMMPNGIVGVGKSFAINIGATGLIYEWAGFGSSNNNVIQNNAFMDLGSTEYTAYNDGALLYSENTTNYRLDHNSVWDARIGLLVDGTTGINVTSNLVTPYRSACPGTQCATPAATTEIGVQDQPGPGPYPYIGGSSANTWSSALSAMDIDSTSSLTNNIFMNRAGYVFTTQRPTNYPNGTYLVQSTDTGADPNVLFTSWQERNNAVPPNGILYRMGNYHLASGQAALYPAADARVIGADIDEITSFIGGIQPAGITGQNNMTGIDVENGIPQFYQRVARNVTVGSTSAVLTYLSDGFACTIQLWPNANYSGTPTLNITDSGATVIGGSLVVPLTGLTANTAYQGKRLCGPEADIIAFTTLASTPALTYQFAPPAGTSTCVIEYGATTALGSSSTPVSVSGGVCSVTVPSTTYWRNDYRNSGGNVTAMSDIRRAVL